MQTINSKIKLWNLLFFDISSNKRGDTLVEVMMAILIISIVAVGGAAFLYYSSAEIAIDSNRRIALEIANARLEDLRAAGFGIISPEQDFDVYYITGQGVNWLLSDNDPEEIVSVNNLDMPIVTTIQYVDDNEADMIDSYDYLNVSVIVGYRQNTGEAVTLNTYIAP